jgi:pathogenesis-related protein 1
MRKRLSPLLLGAIVMAGCLDTAPDNPASDSKDAVAPPQDSERAQEPADRVNRTADGADDTTRTVDQSPAWAIDSGAEEAETTTQDSGNVDRDAFMMALEASNSTSSDAADGANGNPESGRLAGITAAHNAVRAMVQTATPLPPLTWSQTLADYAQQWATGLASNASTCAAPQHRPGSELAALDYGENLSVFGGTGGGKRDGSTPVSVSTAVQAVNSWAAEEMCWTYGTISGTEKCDKTCTNSLHSDGCGHYTQVVWRKSTQVGCGVATCKNGSITEDIWICNYAPAGNFLRQLPY